MKPCRVCGNITDVIVNIRFKATHVCDECCLTITKQTVASLDSLAKECLRPAKPLDATATVE